MTLCRSDKCERLTLFRSDKAPTDARSIGHDMPFDATGSPEDEGATPNATPAPGPLWLRCFIAAMISAMVLMVMGVGWRIADYIAAL